MDGLRKRLFAAELGKGFVEASSPIGRDLQLLLRARADIRRLFGPAEEKVFEQIFRTLEAARVMSNGMADIARGHLSASKQTDLALDTLAECGRIINPTEASPQHQS